MLYALGVAALALPAQASPETCVNSKNYANAQYTVAVHVGTPMQTLNAVPDTGSFELMMTAKGCSGCEGHVMFDRHNSTTFMASGTQVDTTFGQGSVSSEAHYDRVQLGSLVADKQSILLMTKNSLRYFNEAAYDAVMGMGRELKARSYSDDLSLMASLRAPVTGVCVGQHDGEPGRLQVGARVPGVDYVELPVQGRTHWSIGVDSISLGKKGAQASTIDGCGTTGCTVIVDSGTSLMALPKSMYQAILDKIGRIEPDCSNIDSLPDLQLHVGEHTFSLPPQLYVAKMEMDSAAAKVAKLGTSLPSTFRMPWETNTTMLQSGAAECTHLFMEMDVSVNTAGPAMILGLPFFRRYATAFDREKQTVSLGEIPLGSSLCTHCGSSHASNAASVLLTGSTPLAAQPAAPESKHAMQPQAVRERPVLRASGLRLPSFL